MLMTENYQLLIFHNPYNPWLNEILRFIQNDKYSTELTGFFFFSEVSAFSVVSVISGVFVGTTRNRVVLFLCRIKNGACSTAQAPKTV